MRQAQSRLIRFTLAMLVAAAGGSSVAWGQAAVEDPNVAATQNTGPQPTAGALSVPAGINIKTNEPLNLEGDELVYDASASRVTARGNVVITFNGFILKADKVVYDQSARTLTAFGNVRLRDPRGTVTTGERITLTDDFRDGFVEALSVRTSDNTRITARRAIRRDGNVSIFEDGKFTPCKTNGGSPPLWCIAASRVVYDQNKKTIAYEDAQFRVFGTPVLYVPYFEHADPSVKRKSGFLQPGYESSTARGFGITVPYFFALAPGYDFTFSPTYMTKQGVMYQGEWRHRLAFGNVVGSYSLMFAAIDQNVDNLPGGSDPDLDGWRGTIETKGEFSLSAWWRFGWDVTLESDETFRRFYKFDNLLVTDRVNTAYLIGQSERNYFSMLAYHFGGLTLNETVTSRSRVHPVIDWNYIVGQPVLGGELSWNVNALSLSRNGSAVDDGSVNSSHNRVSAEVKWRRKLMDRVGITYTPFATLRGDALVLEEVANGTTGKSDNDTRIRGTAAAGILAAYPWIARTRAASHVIEPVGQVIFRASSDVNQETPNEDSRSLVFDDTNLFEIDKFSGYDRSETGTRANVGVQYTFQANSGGYARLLAGQSFRLDGNNPFAQTGTIVTERGNTEAAISQNNGLETDRSDYVLGLYLSPSRVFTFAGQARFDESDFNLNQAYLYSAVSYGPVYASATYSYVAGETADNNIVATNSLTDTVGTQQEILANVGLRLSQNLSIGTGIRYDIDRSFRVSDYYRVTYADECFVLAVTYSSSYTENTNGELNRDQTVILRFNLKHLGQFQTKQDLGFLGTGD